MPLPVELKDMLKSDIADLQNAKIGNTAGGMLIGGLFLQEFIGFKRKSKTEKLAWAHIDIAGPANNDLGAYGYTGKGATGVIIRTLVSLAKGMAH
jgi:leucyl aminopeptidase